jgi:hypothetical protein
MNFVINVKRLDVPPSGSKGLMLGLIFGLMAGLTSTDAVPTLPRFFAGCGRFWSSFLPAGPMAGEYIAPIIGLAVVEFDGASLGVPLIAGAKRGVVSPDVVVSILFIAGRGGSAADGGRARSSSMFI